jgi:hypothetical protein
MYTINEKTGLKNNFDSYYIEKEKRKKLTMDNRVKHIKECDNCGCIMSKHKYNINQGLCDVCLSLIN